MHAHSAGALTAAEEVLRRDGLRVSTTQEAVIPEPPPEAKPVPTERVEPRVRRPVMPNCQGELGLIGTVVNERDPQLSRVLLRMRGGTAVIAAGGRIDRFVVAAVVSDGVAMRDADGALCALRAGAAVNTAPSMPETPRVSADEAREPTPRGKPVFSAQELAEGVQQLANGEYLVKKVFLLKALTNPGGSAGGAWFRPPKGEAQNGMEVLGVRDGSALNAMGIHNGDVVRELNGISLDAASGLITALRSAREASHVSIAIVRDGSPQHMRYRVE